MQGPCNSKIHLNSEAFNIRVGLLDAFDTPITGPLLTRHVQCIVTLSVVANSCQILSNGNAEGLIQQIDEIGYVTFPNITLNSYDNVECQLQIETEWTLVYQQNDQSFVQTLKDSGGRIQQLCNITVEGCQSSGQRVDLSDSGYATCQGC